MASVGDCGKNMADAGGTNDVFGVGLSAHRISELTALAIAYPLRWCGIDGANAKVVSAALTGPQRLVDSADRDSDDGVGTQKLPGCG
jgi:hypothetical protein